VLFLDRSIDGNHLATELRRRALTVIRHKERFRHDISDVDWLTVAGSEGWVVLTRDKNIRLREIERNALIASNVAAFVFTGGNASGVETAEAVVAALARIEKQVSSIRPPFICRITGSGHVEIIFPTPE
jgi:hypothetical protein